MALFSKNWFGHQVSAGEPLVVKWINRVVAFGKGANRQAEVFKIDGDTGQVVISAPNSKTFVHPVNQLFTTSLGHNGAGAVTLAGTVKGDKVVGVVDVTNHLSRTAGFESVISVAGQIQQSSATDLSAAVLVYLIQKQS